MLQRIGMHDQVETAIGVGHRLHVECGIGAEDMAGQAAQCRRERPCLVDFQQTDWLCLLAFDEIPQSAPPAAGRENGVGQGN